MCVIWQHAVHDRSLLTHLVDLTHHCHLFGRK